MMSQLHFGKGQFVHNTNSNMTAYNGFFFNIKNKTYMFKGFNVFS